MIFFDGAKRKSCSALARGGPQLAQCNTLGARNPPDAIAAERKVAHGESCEEWIETGPFRRGSIGA